MKIYEIIQELNLENGSNYKMEVLKKHKDNEVLKTLLSMTYDKVKYTFGISMLNINETENNSGVITISEALEMLEDLNSRVYTGNSALEYLHGILDMLTIEDADIISKVINRDLRINLGTTNINKVFKDLITKVPYMRCDLYSDKTSKNIKFPAIVQEKCDGMFQYVIKEGENVTFLSRSAEEREFKHLKEKFMNLEDGVYVGELLVRDVTDRAIGNGFINSLDEDKSSVYIQLWDYITLDQFKRPKDKNNKEDYYSRFSHLEFILRDFSSNSDIKLIEYKVVDTLRAALEYTSDIMNQGKEGSILKDYSNIFMDHTSKTQLKLKLEIDIEVRLVGFQEGTKGTKREATFGAFIFENDEGTIKGRCSGFTDKELKEYNSKREELMGKVFTVQFNDLTKGRDNDYYALSHPRFIMFRDDKSETDTLETAFKLKEMAMSLS